jgi:hypothetical protein
MLFFLIDSFFSAPGRNICSHGVFIYYNVQIGGFIYYNEVGPPESSNPEYMYVSNFVCLSYTYTYVRFEATMQLTGGVFFWQLRSEDPAQKARFLFGS